MESLFGEYWEGMGGKRVWKGKEKKEREGQRNRGKSRFGNKGCRGLPLQKSRQREKEKERILITNS